MKNMKNSIFNLSAIILIALFNIVDVEGQAIKKHRIGYIGSIGVTGYQGDLTKDLQDSEYLPNIGIGASYRLDSRYSLRSEFTYFRLGAGQYNANSSTSFKSGNLELNTVLIYDLIKTKRAFIYREKNIPFLFAGLGLTYFNPKVQYTRNSESYQFIDKGNYYGATMSIPFGLGMRVKVSPFSDIAIELGYRKTFTDYLDNVRTINGNYTNVDTRSINTKASVGSFFSQDNYFFVNLKFIYSPKNLIKSKPPIATPAKKFLSKKNIRTSKEIAKSRKLTIFQRIGLADAPGN